MVGARVRRQQVAYAAGARPVAPPRVRLAVGRPVDARVRVAAGRRATRPRSRRCASWPAQYPRYGYRKIRIFLERAGPRDERRPDVSPVAPGRAASAATPAAPARGDEPPAAAAADRRSITCGRTTSCSIRARTGRR